MTSIITNTSAMAALQTLRGIGASLSTTQNQVSTGLRIGSAKDDAAYWSIATTMKSDRGALSAVSDAMGLGAAKVDVAYQGMSNAIDVVAQIKDKLVTASEASVDRGKLQGDIDQLQAQLQSISSSASFAGQNWLSADIGTAGNPAPNHTMGVLGGFTREANGTVSVDVIDYGLSFDNILYNTNATSGYGGLLQVPLNIEGEQAISPISVPFTGTDGSIQHLTQNLATVNSTVLVGSLYHVDPYKGLATDGSGGVYLKVGNDEWVRGSTSQPSPDQIGTSIGGTTYYIDGDSSIIPNHAWDQGTVFSVSTLDVTQIGDYASMAGLTSDDMLGRIVQFVEGQMQSMTSAAATLGSLSSRLDLQTTFASSLMDSIDSGVGKLVDANMEEESSRLAALQTQQQLAVQSLSIANQNSSSIMSLFR